MRTKIQKNENSTFGKTLEEAIRKKFKNQIDFANAIGVTQATVSRYVNETAYPSFHILHKISLVLDLDVPLIKKNENDKNFIYNNSSSIIKLPFLNSEHSAGLWLSNLESNFDTLYFDINWLKNSFIIKDIKDIKDTFSFSIKGDSMNPLIQQGDIVLAKKINNNDTHQGIYLIHYNDNYLINKIQFKRKNLIKLISQNPEYDSMEIDLNDEETSFVLIAKIIGKINTKVFV